MEQALAQLPVKTASRARRLDELVCLVLGSGRTDWLADADRWSYEALEAVPNSVTLLGTRGSVLAELGRNSEARKLLREVWERTESDIDRVYCCLYLAWLDAQDGRHAEAAQRLDQAKVLGVMVAPQARIEKQIADLRVAAGMVA
jgi:hypothetical protein